MKTGADAWNCSPIHGHLRARVPRRWWRLSRIARCCLKPTSIPGTDSGAFSFPRDKQHTSRRSLAVYFYTKERPAAETEASHGTLYVHRQLGEHVQAGHQLDQQDVDEIRALLARRDVHIKFLYDRELDFSRVLEGILKSPSFLIGRALTWPARAHPESERGTEEELTALAARFRRMVVSGLFD